MAIRKVCKDCGRSGILLHLNKELRCDACARAEASRLSMEETVDLVLSGKHGMRKVSRSLPQQFARSERALKNHTALYEKFQRARELERSGEPQAALKEYLELLPYSPQGTEYYVRPCILLERMEAYDEVCDICDQALQSIREGRMQADPQEFQKRKDRVLKKKNR